MKDSLVVDVVHHHDRLAPDGSRRQGPWTSMNFDPVLVREDAR